MWPRRTDISPRTMVRRFPWDRLWIPSIRSQKGSLSDFANALIAKHTLARVTLGKKITLVSRGSDNHHDEPLHGLKTFNSRSKESCPPSKDDRCDPSIRGAPCRPESWSAGRICRQARHGDYPARVGIRWERIAAQDCCPTIAEADPELRYRGYPIAQIAQVTTR